MINIVLAGGSGSRLWPLSRMTFPKQFIHLFGNGSLLRQTIERNILFSEIEKTVIVTNTDHKYLVQKELEDLQTFPLDNILCEPIGKNTAPAIALAVKYLEEKLGVDGSESLFVSPSDHLITPANTFVDYVKEAEQVSRKGYIVTLGIIPKSIETGYGYIRQGEPIGNNVYKVDRFVEKPTITKAEQYVSSNDYLWNSGMFLFTIDTFKKELEEHSPDIFSIYTHPYNEMINRFHEMPEISIDYAIMEKTSRASVVPIKVDWDDVGAWDNVYKILDKDDHQNVSRGNVVTLDTKGCLILGGHRLIGAVGVKDLIITDTDDAILIAQRGSGQKVKELVAQLKNESRREIELHTTTYRPWGTFTILDEGETFKVKRIEVSPGGQLSLQLHYRRYEHWIVVSGKGRVTVGEKTWIVSKNEGIYIPAKSKHRIENLGNVLLVFIEVQVGDFFEEEDIVRFEDRYGRI